MTGTRQRVLDQALVVRSTLEVPLTHVRGASAAPNPLPRGLRLGGTSLPGLVKAGNFYNGTWLFMDIHHAKRAVNIELDYEHCAA